MIPVAHIDVPLGLHRQMQAHVEQDYPNEGCGIMIGRLEGERAILTRVVGAVNQNQERGRDRFEIDPVFYMRTERETGPGEAVIGFFHSHPDCPEIASETDRQFALGWPGFVWLIYRVEQGTCAGLRSWVIDDANEQFVEMTISYPRDNQD